MFLEESLSNLRARVKRLANISRDQGVVACCDQGINQQLFPAIEYAKRLMKRIQYYNEEKVKFYTVAVKWLKEKISETRSCEETIQRRFEENQNSISLGELQQELRIPTPIYFVIEMVRHFISPKASSSNLRAPSFPQKKSQSTQLNVNRERNDKQLNVTEPKMNENKSTQIYLKEFFTLIHTLKDNRQSPTKMPSEQESEFLDFVSAYESDKLEQWTYSLQPFKTDQDTLKVIRGSSSCLSAPAQK